jgi:hypothetical protein
MQLPLDAFTVGDARMQRLLDADPDGWKLRRHHDVHLTGTQCMGHDGRPVQDHVGRQRHERRVLTARRLSF